MRPAPAGAPSSWIARAISAFPPDARLPLDDASASGLVDGRLDPVDDTAADDRQRERVVACIAQVAGRESAAAAWFTCTVAREPRARLLNACARSAGHGAAHFPHDDVFRTVAQDLAHKIPDRHVAATLPGEPDRGPARPGRASSSSRTRTCAGPPAGPTNSPDVASGARAG